MAIEASRLASEFDVALVSRSEPGGHPLGGQIGRSDVARCRGPAEIIVRVSASAPPGLRRVASSVKLAREPPADFLLRPPLRVPQAAVPDPGSADLLLQRPHAVAPQRPVAELTGDASPCVFPVAGSADELSRRFVSAECGK